MGYLLGKHVQLHMVKKEVQACVGLSACLPDLASPATYRDFFSHADLTKVGFHPCAHLPDYRLRWLRLERPLPGVEFIPDCAVGRECTEGLVRTSLGTLESLSLTPTPARQLLGAPTVPSSSLLAGMTSLSSSRTFLKLS